MKKIVLVIAIIAFTFNAFSQENKNKNVSKTSEVTLTAVLHCNDCSEKIKKQLAFERGVKDVSSNHETNLIVVKYRNDKTDVEKIIKSLDEIGYKATVVKEKTKEEKGPSCAGKTDSSKKGCCKNKAQTSSATGIAQNRSACCPTKSQAAEEKKSCAGKAEAGEKKSCCSNKAKAGEKKSCCSDKTKAENKASCGNKKPAGSGCCKKK